MRRASKPFEVPFLSTGDPRFLRLKYQIFKHFEDWLATIEIRAGLYESQRNKKCLYNHKSIKGTKITVHAVTELAHKIFD